MNRNQAIKYLRARETLKERKLAAPLAFFRPHARQRAFFDGLAARRGVLMSGGNRSGKTVANAVAAVCFAYGYWIFDVPDLRLTDEGDYPPRHAISPEHWIRRPDGVPLREAPEGVVVSGLPMREGIDAVFWPELRRWLPAALVPRLKLSRAGNPPVVVRAEHPDGLWSMRFGSVEQGAMPFEGKKYDWAAFDEPPHRPVFEAVWRGLTDFYAPFWLTFTPLGHHAPWLWEEFYTGARDDITIVEVEQDDNPYLTVEAREAFVAGMASAADETLEARRRGRFGFLTHRAFPTYDREVHFVDDVALHKDWPRMLVCDPANRRPYYFLWLAFDPLREDWHAYREFPMERMHHTYRTSEWSTRDYATIIRNLEGEEKVASRVIDPRSGKSEYFQKGERTTSFVEDFARYGLYFDANVPDVAREETGIARIRELLWYDPKLPVGMHNRPHLYVHTSCRSLDHSLANYSFVPPGVRDDRELPEKTTAAFKDAVDALRYGLLYGAPTRIPTSGYIPQRDIEDENALEIDSSWL